MFYYKLDVLKQLRKAGYTQKRIRQEEIIEESVILQLKENKIVRMEDLQIICNLLELQPGDIIGNNDRKSLTNKVTNVIININLNEKGDKIC